MHKVISVMLLFSLAFVFCKNQPAKPVAEAVENATELPADFVEFYKKFHEDSLFQLEHVQFPLAGRQAERGADGTMNISLNWSREEWKMMHLPPLNTGEFRRDFMPISPGLISETIKTSEEVGYSIERRFGKLGRDWSLIYYSAGFRE